MADLAKLADLAGLAGLAERVKAGAGAKARLLPGEKGRARRGQPRPARRCSLSMRAGGAPACRAGHGAGGDEGRSGVPERRGLRSGWQGRGRGCRLRQARRSACAALETSPGAAGRGACQTGPRHAGWRARPLAEGCRARGTNLPEPALAGAGRGPCPHPVPSRRPERRSQAGSGAVQPAPARQVPARPWHLRGLGPKKGHLHRCRCRNLWWVTGDSNSEPID